MENSPKINIQNIYGDLLTIIGANGGVVENSKEKDCIVCRIENKLLLLLDTKPLQRINNSAPFGIVDEESKAPITIIGATNTLIKNGIIEGEPLNFFNTSYGKISSFLERARDNSLNGKSENINFSFEKELELQSVCDKSTTRSIDDSREFI